MEIKVGIMFLKLINRVSVIIQTKKMVFSLCLGTISVFSLELLQLLRLMIIHLISTSQ
jgi:hypothetical protein